eukprot:762128-Hanusia_phi.AAC.10
MLPSVPSSGMSSVSGKDMRTCLAVGFLRFPLKGPHRVESRVRGQDLQPEQSTSAAPQGPDAPALRRAHPNPTPAREAEP